jgi:hypothetical protein
MTQIDTPFKQDARAVAQHLGRVATELGQSHPGYASLNSLREPLYKIAYADTFKGSLTASVAALDDYMAAEGNRADPMVAAFHEKYRAELDALRQGQSLPQPTQPRKRAPDDDENTQRAR